MANFRHWKQRFDFDAKLVFRKSRKLGLCGQERCEPGDPVTDEMKEALGRHRLKMWWEAGLVEIQRLPESSVTEPTPVVPPAPPEPSAEGLVEHTGNGWYNVTLSDGSIQLVRGRENAEDLLDG